jgi:hypothetical protein
VGASVAVGEHLAPASYVNPPIHLDLTDDTTAREVLALPFRRGVASALLDELDRRFLARPIVVSTGSANEPALRLYARRGFAVLHEREVVPGLVIAELGRGPSRNGEAEITDPRVV